MSVEIVDVRGSVSAREGDVFVAEEARTYLIRAPGALEVWLGDRQLLAGSSGHYEVELGQYVGLLDLRILTGDGSVANHKISVRPRADKLSPTLWLSLLEELEEGLAGLSVGVMGPTQGAVVTNGVSAPLLVSTLLPLIPALVAALRAILDDPRWIDREHHDERELHECRRIDSSTLTWIGRHPQVGRWLDRWRAAELVERPPRVPVRTAIHTLDHPVNRYVAWLTNQVVERLVETADRLDELARIIDDPVWCRGRATRVRASAGRLRTIRDGSWLREITPEPASEVALLVVADDPAYARFQRLARRFCSPAFRLEASAGDPGAAVRPSFSLYELWCFFALRQHLAVALPNWSWSAIGLDNLLTLTGSGCGAAFVALCGEQRLRIDFNLTFRSLYCRGDGPYSLSSERRPDFVVRQDGGPQGARWVVLDAKYRAGRENLAKALASVHLYRDALTDPARGGRCAGAMLLAPRACEVPEWFDPVWQHTHGFGITALAPGMYSPALASWICQCLGLENEPMPLLGRSTKQSSRSEATSPTP